MKAVFSGYYGAKNSGDDAFCDVAAWGAKKYWNVRQPLFFSASLPRMLVDARNYAPHRDHAAFARGVLDVFTSDMFVSAGGSTYHSKLKPSDFRTYAQLKKKLRCPGKSAAIGISLGPYRNSDAEKSTVSYLRTLDYLALRDTRSYELAMSYSLPKQPVLAFDLAALLPEMYGKVQPKIDRKRKVVGVSVCNYERYTGGDLTKEESRNSFVRDLIRSVGETMDVHFRFFIFNGNELNGDEGAIADVVAALPKGVSYEVIPYLGDVQRTFFMINECDVVLAVRLHAAVFACFGETPFLLVEYHDKCTDFLDDVGQGVRYRLGDGDVGVREARDRLGELLTGVDPPSQLVQVRRRALLNFVWN